MPTLAAGNKRAAPRNLGGFTLLELLVVLCIVAVGTAAVTLAMRDAGATNLQRDAERLAVLLESARAQSQLAGVPVLWQPRAGGFRFAGLPDAALAHDWLDPATRSTRTEAIALGPEPIIGNAQIVLQNSAVPGTQWRVWSDGARPFLAEPQQAVP